MPTGQAAALYDEVALAFESVDRVMSLVGRMRAHNTGTLTIAVPYSFCETLLPRLLARLSKGRPQLRYAIEQAAYEDIVVKVAKRHADIGIVKEPVEHPGVSTLPLIDSMAACAMPQGHRLSKFAKITPEHLASEPLIQLGSHKLWRYEMLAVFRRHGLTPTVRIEAHSVGAACGFVAAGMGLSVVPELLGAQYADRGITLRPLTVSIDHRFAIAFPKGLQRSGLATDFTTTARRVARELIRAGRK
jgi:DNA-binding transcriptional LysR family regulator